jgi:hypothetical protein
MSLQPWTRWAEGARKAGRNRRWRSLASTLVLAVAASAWVTLATSCSDDDNGFGPKPPSGSTATGAGGSSGPCTDGDTTSCHVTIGEEGGILTCLDGTKVCVAGEWGPCEGSFTAQPMPKKSPGGRGAPGGSSAYPSPLSLSVPVSCMSNPCDPSCQVFDEVPPGGVVAPPPGSFGGCQQRAGSGHRQREDLPLEDERQDAGEEDDHEAHAQRGAQVREVLLGDEGVGGDAQEDAAHQEEGVAHRIETEGVTEAARDDLADRGGRLQRPRGESGWKILVIDLLASRNITCAAGAWRPRRVESPQEESRCDLPFARSGSRFSWAW